MAALTFIAQKSAGDLLAPRQLLYSPLEFRALHSSIIGQICPYETGRLVHFPHVRPDAFAGEPAHGALEELLVFGEYGQRLRCSFQMIDSGHVSSLLHRAMDPQCDRE